MLYNQYLLFWVLYPVHQQIVATSNDNMNLLLYEKIIIYAFHHSSQALSTFHIPKVNIYFQSTENSRWYLHWCSIYIYFQFKIFKLKKKKNQNQNLKVLTWQHCNNLLKYSMHTIYFNLIQIKDLCATLKP